MTCVYWTVEEEYENLMSKQTVHPGVPGSVGTRTRTGRAYEVQRGGWPTSAALSEGT